MQNSVRVGRVTLRRYARQHLAINGRAHCGAGNGWIIPVTSMRAGGNLKAADICRRCIRALRAALDALSQQAATPFRDTQAARDALAALRTPAQVASDTADLNVIAARVFPQPVPEVPAGTYAERLSALLA